MCPHVDQNYAMTEEDTHNYKVTAKQTNIINWEQLRKQGDTRKGVTSKWDRKHMEKHVK